MASSSFSLVSPHTHGTNSICLSLDELVTNSKGIRYSQKDILAIYLQSLTFLAKDQKDLLRKAVEGIDGEGSFIPNAGEIKKAFILYDKCVKQLIPEDDVLAGSYVPSLLRSTFIKIYNKIVHEEKFFLLQSRSLVLLDAFLAQENIVQAGRKVLPKSLVHYFYTGKEGCRIYEKAEEIKALKERISDLSESLRQVMSIVDRASSKKFYPPVTIEEGNFRCISGKIWNLSPAVIRHGVIAYNAIRAQDDQQELFTRNIDEIYTYQGGVDFTATGILQKLAEEYFKEFGTRDCQYVAVVRLVQGIYAKGVNQVCYDALTNILEGSEGNSGLLARLEKQKEEIDEMSFRLAGPRVLQHPLSDCKEGDFSFLTDDLSQRVMTVSFLGAQATVGQTPSIWEILKEGVERFADFQKRKQFYSAQPVYKAFEESSEQQALGHTGLSHSWMLENLEDIATQGWSGYVQEHLIHIAKNYGFGSLHRSNGVFLN
ncbi:MAG: hypothetical protein P4L16_07935 [Chlamydiales bacterium]|nr:hypothetical protein [Chlamydiales bacterium]